MAPQVEAQAGRRNALAQLVGDRRRPSGARTLTLTLSLTLTLALAPTQAELVDGNLANFGLSELYMNQKLMLCGQASKLVR